MTAPITLSDAEQRLVEAWRQNSCEIHGCVSQRLEAALLVIRGGKTHSQYAQIVQEAAEQTMKR